MMASVIRFDLEETPVEAVIEEADTLPFLQERKLIIAGNANFLNAQDKNREKVTHNLTQLETGLQTRLQLLRLYLLHHMKSWMQGSGLRKS